ncbi:MAG: LysM peptidoglycan-binding domain-containing protein [Bacilli bacterium]|nr:LysM peptidoglycan-binding domain-containing protein [Bacilli bacterium]
MKKKINIEKRVDFPTMIGEITAIALDHDLKFIDNLNVNGDLILSGKYKMTEASRLEEDFLYKFPIEIALTEKVDLNTTKIEISDFYYEIENDDIMKCHVDLDIEGLEVVDFCDDLFEDRECDGDKNKEVEIPKKEVIEPPVEEERHDEEEIEELIEDKKDDINIMNFDDDNETYGTFVVYIVRQNETVNSILEKYNTTIEELEKYNDLKNINIGTKLIIPILKDKE